MGCCTSSQPDADDDKSNLHVDRTPSKPAASQGTMREPLIPAPQPVAEASRPQGHMRGESSLKDWMLDISIPPEDAATYAHKLKADGFDSVVRATQRVEI